MLAERIIFNILAFSLFIILFFKMIRKNDTSYIVVLTMEAIGIAIGFIEMAVGKYFGGFLRFFTYFFAVVVPLAIVIVEYKKKSYPELFYITLSKACTLLRKDRRAKGFLIALVTKYPNSYVGHKLLAELYEKEGGMRKAIDEYVTVIDLNKKDYDSYYKIAYLLEQNDRKKESVEMLQNLIRIKPEYYKASQLLGSLLCEQENFKEAINVYMSALRYCPNDYDTYYNLGIAYSRLNDFQNAKTCYEKAAYLNYLEYNCDYCLGVIALMYDDIDEAEKYFLESIQGEEVEAKSYYHLSRIYMLRGEKEKAINHLNLAIELDETMIQKALEDPIFIVIKGYIPTSIKAVNKIQKKKLSKKEIAVMEHLENTYYLSKKLSRNDLKQMHKLEGKGITIEKETDGIEKQR